MTDGAQVGLFWVVEANGRPAIIALTVPLDRSDQYGDMRTLDRGHDEYWTQLARMGARAMREAGIPAAPVWSEYDEWPRGRVLFDTSAGCFVVRSDRQLHRPAFRQLIADRFGIGVASVRFLADEHYRSVRRLPG